MPIYSFVAGGGLSEYRSWSEFRSSCGRDAHKPLGSRRPLSTVHLKATACPEETSQVDISSSRCVSSFCGRGSYEGPASRHLRGHKGSLLLHGSVGFMQFLQGQGQEKAGTQAVTVSHTFPFGQNLMLVHRRPSPISKPGRARPLFTTLVAKTLRRREFLGEGGAS